MKHYHFTTVVKNQIDRSRKVLLGKSDEYATAQDRLHNFRVSATMQGITQKQALGGMMSKHTTSIYDMIRSDEDISMAQWDEKITDHINYLLLLRAMVEEELMVDPGDDEVAVSRSHQDKSKEEQDAGKHETPGILEERGGEITGRATETTEQD